MTASFTIGDRPLGAGGDIHPDWSRAQAELTAWRVVAASAIGPLHLARSIVRQDAFQIRGRGSWLAVAVSDGLGSRPNSQFGSTWVVEALTHTLLEQACPLEQITGLPSEAKQPPRSVTSPVIFAEVPAAPFQGIVKRRARRRSTFWALPEPEESLERIGNLAHANSSAWWMIDRQDEGANRNAGVGELQPGFLQAATPSSEPVSSSVLTGWMDHAFENAFEELSRTALKLKFELRELACTGLGVLINLDTGQGAVGQIGDGAIFGLDGSGTVRLLVCPPEPDDPQVTYALNTPLYRRHLAVNLLNNPGKDGWQAILAMTDGISADWLYGPEPAMSRWVRELARNAKGYASAHLASAGMLQWLASYRMMGSWDDRTLVILTRT